MGRKNTYGALTIRKALLMLAMFAAGLSAFAQCDIKNKVGPDGTMYYFMDRARFYYTSEKQLDGGLVTDKEHYFLTLHPVPFPSRREAEKLKDPAIVVLSNAREYKLQNFASLYIKEDSVVRMMFLIPQDVLDDFRKYDIESVGLNMGKDEGLRSYKFSLHKSALREHLACFLDKKDN